jgi:hypothetical protein
LDSGKWFTNPGQIIQIALTAIGCAFAGVKAWPDIKSNDLVSVATIVFLILLTILAFSIGRAIAWPRTEKPSTIPVPILQSSLSAPVLQQPLPLVETHVHAQNERSCTASVRLFSVSLPLGAFVDLPGTDIRIDFRELRPHQDPRPGEEPYAPVLEVNCGGGLVYGGERTTKVHVNRYCMPISQFEHEPYSIYYQRFSERYLHFFALYVEHINPQASILTLQVCIAKS